MTIKRAVFPGTFDPITLGHLDVIAKAQTLFDEVIIAVTDGNSQKTPFIPLAKRHALIETATQAWSTVKVHCFEGLLVAFVKAQQAQWVIRSARNTLEFDHEQQQALANQLLLPDCETVLLLPSADMASVSSTLIREIAQNGGDLSRFVPKCVENELLAKEG